MTALAPRSRPDPDAVAAFEAFVHRVTGSGVRARRAADVVRARVAHQLEAGEARGHPDRALLFRALGERPALLGIDPATIEPDAGTLPWRLAELPEALRLPWTLRECAGWREGEIAWLCGSSPRRIHRALVAADNRVERGVAADVLIVGEQPMVLLELRRLLADAGHTVVGTGSTRTRAVSLAALSPPDLVVADIEHAGDESALAAVRVLEGRLDAPFVMLQDTASRDVATDGVAVSASPRTLVKPCDPDEIRRACVRALLFDTRAEDARRRRAADRARL